MTRSVTVRSSATHIRNARPVPQQLLELDIEGNPNEVLHIETGLPLRVLLRRASAPIAWVRVDRPSPELTRFQLLQLATHQLCSTSVAALMREHIDSDAPALPPISVVVCTRDRPQSLQRCLDSFRTL